MSGNPAVYDANRGRQCFLADSYWGGEHYRNPSSPTLGNAALYRYTQSTAEDGRQVVVSTLDRTFRSYLVPHPGERSEQFQARINLGVYVNIVQPIVDAYVDAIQGGVRRDLGALKDYTSNLDGQGRTWESHMGEVARWTALHGFTATVVDTPRANPAANAAQERDLGISPRAIIVTPPAIAWVDVDDDGALNSFAYVDQPFMDSQVGARRPKVRLWCFYRDHWESRTVTLADGRGLYEQREKFLKPQTLVDEGPVSLGRVPVQFAYYRQVSTSRWPLGVSLVTDAADAARVVFNELSNAESIHRQTAFPFLAIPSGATGGALSPGTQVQVGPDTALGYRADAGVPSWVQPSAESTRELREHSMFLFQLAFRTAGLEVAADASAQAQSGEALRIRSRDFDSRAGKFAKALEDYETRTLAMVGAVMGQPGATASLSYPKRYTLPDSSEDLARAVLLLQSFWDELGADGKAQVVRQALNAGLSLSDQDVDSIMDEVRLNLASGNPKPGVPALRDPAARPGLPFTGQG